MTTLKSVDDRFWEKVNKTEACWLWTAAKNQQGYGRFRLNGVLQFAHRISYEKVHGSIPEGLEIDHMCHVRACVNPAHLRPVTSKQNRENHAGAYASSSTGIRGVHWNQRKRKWHVQVGHAGKRYYGGLFTDIAEAEQAVIAMRNRLFTHNDQDRNGVSK